MKFFFKFLAAVMVLVAGCDDKTTPPPPVNTDPGILRTDEFGNILGGDTTDWCLQNLPEFSFGAAYPNPTHGPSVTVPFKIPAEDTVKIFFLKSGGDSTVYFNGRVAPGSYQLLINDSAGQYTNTYQRVYMSSKVNFPSSGCRFYGDIRFEP
jgi:hypothetical protein